MTQQKEFVKGLFASKSKNEKFIDLSIKKSDFLKSIESFEEDEKGYVRFSMAEQKADPNKYSVWLNNWKPSKEKKVETASNEGYDNDLPF